MTGRRNWNIARWWKSWSAVGVIHLDARLGLGMGLVRIQSLGCDKEPSEKY